MKKVFIVHGLEGSPNGGWRPWLMGELEKHDIYACALSMPGDENPLCEEWIEEIARHVERSKNDEIYLVGHSLGVPAILRFLEKTEVKISGVVLVSGPYEMTDNEKVNRFMEGGFDFENIKKKAGKFVVIHGDKDDIVPFGDAEILTKELRAELIVIPGGRHLNGGSGCFSLPQCLDALLKMMQI